MTRGALRRPAGRAGDAARPSAISPAAPPPTSARTPAGRGEADRDRDKQTAWRRARRAPHRAGRRSAAGRARVSLATVSAVLNDSAFVSPDLKTRVQTAIAALGYQPNLLARGLAKKRSQTLGMIVPDIANPFFPEVGRGAEDTAHAAGYTLLIASSDNDPKKEEVYLRLFLAKRADGVMLTKAPGRLSRELANAYAGARVPI